MHPASIARKRHSPAIGEHDRFAGPDAHTAIMPSGIEDLGAAVTCFRDRSRPIVLPVPDLRLNLLVARLAAP